MTILDKLMEKKDLKAYIAFRIEFLEHERESEMMKLPESERGFFRERFIGRIFELKKLKDVLEEDQIKIRSKQYFRKTNNKKV